MQAFKNYVEKLVNDTRKTKTETILNGAVNIQKELDKEKLTGNSAVTFIDNHRTLITGIIPCGAAIWIKIPHAGKVAILNFLYESAKNMTALSLVFANESISGIIAKVANLAKYGKLVSITLASIPVIYEILRSVYLWWNGRISGQRAGKNVADSFMTAIAGYGGAVAGALAGGAIANVPGAIIGGIIGGVAGGIAGNKLAQMITDAIFDLPKTQALENAYNYLNVHHRASDAEVKAAYNRCALRDHPDKPTGSKEAFCKLQAYIAIIRMARGEIVDEK